MLALDRLAGVIGPAGDVLHIPMLITGGVVTGIGKPMPVAGGTDFGSMHADERFVHDGNFVVSDPLGDIIVWYDGTAEAPEGAYDDVLDGQLPGKIPCRLHVRTVATNAAWRPLNRQPLAGVGWFDGAARTLEFTLLALPGDAGR